MMQQLIVLQNLNAYKIIFFISYIKIHGILTRTVWGARSKEEAGQCGKRKCRSSEHLILGNKGVYRSYPCVVRELPWVHPGQAPILVVWLLGGSRAAPCLLCRLVASQRDHSLLELGGSPNMARTGSGTTPGLFYSISSFHTWDWPLPQGIFK